MKTHARNVAVGGLLVPLALALATLVANEAQTLIGLHLDNVSLSLYLMPFLLAAGLAIAALLRLEAAKIGGDLGAALGDMGGLLEGLLGEGGGKPPAAADSPWPPPPPGFEPPSGAPTLPPAP